MSLNKLFSRSEKSKSPSHSRSPSGLSSLFSSSKPAPTPSSEDKEERPDVPSTQEPSSPPLEHQDGSDGPIGTTEPSKEDGADPDTRDAKLDIVFVQDTTASQSPYIDAAKAAINSICDKVTKRTKIAPQNIRFGLVAFRDHPPQDRTYVTKEFGFTSETSVMEENLKSLRAQGGGDGPEAVTAALAAALNMPWDEKAGKMIVLITDAPPHGIGEQNDGFDSSPDQNDPLELARQMAQDGITLHMVACEPTLSQAYTNAVDFYAALTEITGGKMLPLTMVDKLGDYIAGTAIETVEAEELIKQYQSKIVDNVYGQAKDLDSVVEEMHKALQEKKVQMSSVQTEDAYIATPTATANKATWMSAKKVGVAQAKVSKVSGARYASSSAAPAPPAMPAYSSEYDASAPRWSPSVPSLAPGLGAVPTGYWGAAPPPPNSFSVAPGAPPPAPSALSYAPVPPPSVPSASSYARAPLAAPSAPVASSTISYEQTKRLVMQSVARSSKVTESGMTAKESAEKP